MLGWKETLVRSFYNHRKDIWTFAGIQNCENLPADSRSAVGKASLSADWSRISLWTAALPGSQHWDGAGRNVTPLPSSLLLLAAVGEHTGANILSVAHYSLQGQWEEAFN